MLTYMATLAELCERGELVMVGGGLEPYEQPMRLLYASPKVIDWFEHVLPDLEPVIDEGRQSPLEQVHDLLHDYVVGADMSYWARSHSMTPEEQGFWELKSPDVRLFGWFVASCKFVIACSGSKADILTYGLNEGYKNQAFWFRDQLDLDEPKYVLGDYSNVL